MGLEIKPNSDISADLGPKLEKKKIKLNLKPDPLKVTERKIRLVERKKRKMYNPWKNGSLLPNTTATLKDCY